MPPRIQGPRGLPFLRGCECVTLAARTLDMNITPHRSFQWVGTETNGITTYTLQLLHGCSLYEALARTFASLQIMPCKDGVKHARYGYSENGWHEYLGERIPQDLQERWIYESYRRDYNAVIFPAAVGLVVIDIDDVQDLAWAVETYGDTPFKVWTWRGVHLYYRCDRAIHKDTGLVGPRFKDGTHQTYVDVQGDKGTVVGPGTCWEREGVPYAYRLSWNPLESDVATEAPMLPYSIHSKLCKEARAYKQEHRHKLPKREGKRGGGQVVGVSGDWEIMEPVSVSLEIPSVGVTLGQIVEGEKFHSPFREDNNPSCAVFEGSLYDYSTRQRWRIEYSNLDLDALVTPDGASHIDMFLINKKTSLCATPSLWEQMLDLGNQIRAESAKEDSRPLFVHVKAPMGSGKTFVAADLTKETGDGSCLIVNTLVSLATASAARFGAALYSEFEGDGGPNVSTTLKSLHRFPPGRSTIVLDEYNEISRFLVSGLIQDPGHVLDLLQKQVSQAKLVIAAGSDLTDYDLNLSRRLFPDCRFLDLEIPPLPNQRIVRLQQNRYVEEQFFQHVETMEPGDRVFLAVTSTDAPETYAERVKEHNPDLSTFWISSRNRDKKEVQDELKNPDGIWEKHDVIIFSPTVKSGVDFQEKVDRGFVLHKARDMVPSSVCQMLMRCRDLANPEILVGVPVQQVEAQSAESEVLRNIALYGKEYSGEQAKYFLKTSLVKHTYDVDTNRVPVNENVLDIWVKAAQERILAHNEPVKAFLEEAQRHGWGYVDQSQHKREELGLQSVKGFVKRMREIKHRVFLEHVQRVKEAEAIDKTTLSLIEAKHTKTQEEKDAAEQAKIREFYGEVDYGNGPIPLEAVIETDYRGEFRGPCRQWAKLQLYAGADPNGRDYLAKRQADSLHNDDLIQVNRDLVKTMCFADLVFHLFGHYMGPEQEGEFTTSQLKEKIIPLLQGTDFLTRWKLAFQKDFPNMDTDYAVRSLVKTLARTGIECEKKDRRIEGKPARVYCFSSFTVSHYAVHELDRLKREAGKAFRNEGLYSLLAFGKLDLPPKDKDEKTNTISQPI